MQFKYKAQAFCCYGVPQVDSLGDSASILREGFIRCRIKLMVVLHQGHVYLSSSYLLVARKG